MGCKMGDWVQQFKARFGDAVTTDMVALAIQGVQPACACAPESEEQAAAMIRFAAAHRIPLVPCGNGTSQGRCAPPPPGFLALSTKRLNKLIHHEPGDMVATVQSGMSFFEFEHALREHSQWLPLDAGYSTIGGSIVTNAHGPRALGFGTLRDMVLGMTVINGDGVIRKCGGKVVKNVTGYALDKLYIGSFGTLGLITEVTFKLQPLMPTFHLKYAKLSNIDAGVNALEILAKKNLPLEMLQIYVRGIDEGPLLFVTATGTDAEMDRIREEVSNAVPLEYSGHYVHFNTSRVWSHEEYGFNHREFYAGIENRIFQEAIERTSVGATLRFGCVRSKLSAVMKVLQSFQTWPQSIGMTGGIIDMSPLSDSEAARIATEFEKLGVNFAFENIVGVNIPNRWGTPRPEWAIMKQIKAALDPQGIMNPGRFVV